MVIVVGILFSRLVVKITALSSNLEMSLCRVTRGLTASVATLLASAHLALLTPQSARRGAIKAGIVYRVPEAVGQKGLQAHINADIRMGTGRGSVFGLRVSFTDDEGIPMTISTMNEVNRLGRALYRAMHLDFEGLAYLLGNDEMFSVFMQIAILAVLPQLNGMPAIRLLETRKTNVRDVILLGCQKTFERFREAVCQHLHCGGWHMFPLPLEGFFHVILAWESPLLCILMLDSLKHGIVNAARLSQAGHEQAGLFFGGKKSVLKRSHRDILP